MATYDPVSTATALAENYVYARQAQVNTGTAKTQAQTTALNSLKTSLTTFTTALSAFSAKGGVVQQTTSVSEAAAATASAASNASAGVYQFEVKNLATAQQSLYRLESLGLKPTGPGETQSQVVVSLGGGGFFSVDLGDADTDGDGALSVTEVARAINTASQGKVSAAVMTVNGEQQLLLNAAQTGTDGAFQLHTFDSAKTDEWIKEYLKPADNSAPGLADLVTPAREMSVAGNAKIVVGGVGGVEIEQSTNTYTGIDGLSVTFKAVSSTPVAVTVSKDEASTVATMQSFVTAYNTLVKAIDKLTASGNADSGVSAGALAGDSGMRSLRNQLNSLLRTQAGGVSLMDYGISAQRDGTIALDSARFNKKVAANPAALDTLLGATNTLDNKRSGVLGSLQTYSESWTKTSGGYLQSRQDGLQKQQTQYTKDQATIDRLYTQAYQRYLTQFTALANLEATMSNTTSYLSAMFSSSSKS